MSAVNYTASYSGLIQILQGQSFVVSAVDATGNSTRGNVQTVIAGVPAVGAPYLPSIGLALLAPT
jgi:hypothetical protein